MRLFGLALYSANRRAKEIGIRKVMGASVGQIAILVSRDFLVLVLVALVTVGWQAARAAKANPIETLRSE